MSRVITFSIQYPSYHSRKGERTLFIEKVWASLVDQQIAFPEFWEEWYNLNCAYDFDGNGFSNTTIEPKHHTIRAGKRYKAGMKVSPRFWSGKPYASKQITFAPDIEIKKVFDFEIKVEGEDVCIFIDNYPLYQEGEDVVTGLYELNELAKNDGLTIEDFKSWFKWPKAFSGQIIAWNQNIIYNGE